MNVFRHRQKALLLALGIITVFVAQAIPPAQSEPAELNENVPLFENLGTLHHEITTAHPRAQEYFNQGLRFIYAFNHEEAIRSFEQAVMLDPDAAMAYWGIAYALGPNINAPMDREQERRAYEAVQKARAKAGHVTPRERAYIEALSIRYSIAPHADRQALDSAYAERMRHLYRADPTDADAATMFAEALMNLRPWDYWTHDGRPQPDTMEIVGTLEETLERNPDHIGACHYYIHAVEAWQPERAVPCAERLPRLAPGAGHLVHMPSHIYIRVGRYEEAAERNRHAISADRHYLEGRHVSGMYPIGYYPHNIHFLWSALIMQGRSQEALKVGHELIPAVSLDTIRQAPELEFLLSPPLLTMVRFGHWDNVLGQPAPPADLAYSLALWHYGRGLGLAAKGQLGAAEEARQKLQEISDATPPERIVGLNSAKVLLGIALHVLGGQIAAKSGQVEKARTDFEQAVRLQDGLRYYEPPDWYYPVRESLGRFLLAAGDAGEAERVFREDLRRTPENPWSLHGLAESLHVQKKERDGATINERFQKAWSAADVEFQPARFEAFLAGDPMAETKKDPHR